jgi:hypothetical protein
MAGLRELQLKDAAGLTGTLPSNLSWPNLKLL